LFFLLTYTIEDDDKEDEEEEMVAEYDENLSAAAEEALEKFHKYVNCDWSGEGKGKGRGEEMGDG
jgi:hypothetical protein